MKNFVGFLRQTFQAFGKDKVGQLSAAFAYAAIFSIGPLLLVVISIIGFVFGAQAVQGEIASKLAGTVGPDAAKTLQSVIAASHKASSGILALVIGIIGSLLGASGITGQLQTSLNTIFEVVPDPRGGIKRTIYVKLKNIGLVIAGGILVVASLVLSAVVIGLGKKVEQQFGIPATALELIDSLVSLSVFVGLLYALYRTVPDVRVPRKLVLSTAVIVSLLFLISKIILGSIIGRNGTASAYGAAASLVTLLLWIYYSGQIIFLGAEGMKIYGQAHAITFEAKRFTLKRSTLTLDTHNGIGKLLEAWQRGFSNAQKQKRK